MQSIEADFQENYNAAYEFAISINKTIDDAERLFAKLATGELKIDVPRDRFDCFATGSLPDGATASLVFKDGSLFMSVADENDPANAWVRPIRDCEGGIQFVTSFTIPDLLACWANGGVPQPMDTMDEIVKKVSPQ